MSWNIRPLRLKFPNWKNSGQEEKEICWLRRRNGPLFDGQDFVPKAGTGSSRTPPHKKDGDCRFGYSG